MQTFDQSVLGLLRDGLITEEEALKNCNNPNELALKLKGILRLVRPDLAAGGRGPSQFHADHRSRAAAHRRAPSGRGSAWHRAIGSHRSRARGRMFRKVLIANRGEIALRVMRACRELRISTVAVFSEADRDSLHVRLADESVCIGPPPPAQSYNYIRAPDLGRRGHRRRRDPSRLRVPVRERALRRGVRLVRLHVHRPDARDDPPHGRQGRGAAHHDADAGLPLVPGSEGVLADADEAQSLIAKEIGYPVIIKASAGGGGRGMRVAWDEKSAARRIRHRAGGSGGRVQQRRGLPREVHRHARGTSSSSCSATRHGNLIHLGERECSMQRNHQKLIEEAPSPFLTEAQRHEVGAMAVQGREVRSATSTPARWSSCSTRTARATSWR